MKEVLAEAGVPTARFGVFDELERGRARLPAEPARALGGQDRRAGRRQGRAGHRRPWTRPRPTSTAKLSGAAFGDAGRQVVIEEGLAGAGVLAARAVRRHAGPCRSPRPRTSSGSATATPGPTPGGMGAYSPVPVVDDRRGRPAGGRGGARRSSASCGARGIDYRGVLYAGLMLTADGPKVLEFNVRFGDPETQVVLPAPGGDLAELLLAVADGDLDAVRTARASRATPPCAWCWPSPGYPEAPRAGDAIDGPAPPPDSPWPRSTGSTVFHAGTGPAQRRRARSVTAGGRVLGVTAVGADARRGPGAGLRRPPRHRAGTGMQLRPDIAARRVHPARRGAALERGRGPR